MAEITPHDMMVRYAADTVSYARDTHGIRLDYSLKSLASLRAIVAILHAEVPKGPLGRFKGEALSREEIKGMSAMLGGYAGEVYRRDGGGEWRLEAKTGACGVVRDDVWIFPIQRIHTEMKTGLASDYLAPLSPDELKI